LLAGDAGSVRRYWFYNSGRSCACLIILFVQQGFSFIFEDATSKAVKSLQIRDGVGGAVDSFCSNWVLLQLFFNVVFQRMMFYSLGG
jgi:hypothetical protein